MGMLDGRVAICTGAARGVGAEVAKLMAAHGAKIVVVDPGVGGAGEGGDQRPAQVTVDEIKASGGEAAANVGSVAECDDCLAMVQQARDTFGGLHIVFNAAGILRDKMFHNMFPEDWQAVIDVHLTGHFNVNRAAINLFREQNYGRLILVSSTSGLLGNIGQVNYGSAKFALVPVARILAMGNTSPRLTPHGIRPSAAPPGPAGGWGGRSPHPNPPRQAGEGGGRGAIETLPCLRGGGGPIRKGWGGGGSRGAPGAGAGGGGAPAAGTVIVGARVGVGV